MGCVFVVSVVFFGFCRSVPGFSFPVFRSGGRMPRSVRSVSAMRRRACGVPQPRNARRVRIVRCARPRHGKDRDYFPDVRKRVSSLHGQPHDVVERAVDAFDGRMADPLLNAVGSGFVVGAEGVGVVDELLLREGPEPHVGGRAESRGALRAAERHARDDRVACAREAAEHREGFVALGGLAQHAVVEHHHGIGREQDVAGAECGGTGLALEAREVEGNLACGSSGGVNLLAGVLRGGFVGDAAGREQFAAAGRLRCQQQPAVAEHFVEQHGMRSCVRIVFWMRGRARCGGCRPGARGPRVSVCRNRGGSGLRAAPGGCRPDVRDLRPRGCP